MLKNVSEWNIEGVAAGDLQVVLAESEDEINFAKELRYQIFVNEMGAKPTEKMRRELKDSDEFDEFCDHLLVKDRSVRVGNPIVGTYRLLRRSQAKKLGKFYTASEFDIKNIEKSAGEILELGRSCVHANYRTRAVMQLLWRGIAVYVFHHDIKLMFGCASFPGTDAKTHKTQLSYLYNYHLAPKEICAKALAGRYVDMNLIPKEEIDPVKAAISLPPLIKGYLRLGGYVGDGAVFDNEYNTTDVCIILKTDLVTDKYYKRYAPDEMKEQKD